MSIWGPEHKIDKLFNRKLQNFEMQNPDHLWEKIATQLDKGKTGVVPPLSWLSALLITVSILAGGIASYFYFSQSSSSINNIEINNEGPERDIQAGIEDMGKSGVTMKVIPNTNNYDEKGNSPQEHMADHSKQTNISSVEVKRKENEQSYTSKAARNAKTLVHSNGEIITGESRSKISLHEANRPYIGRKEDEGTHDFVLNNDRNLYSFDPLALKRSYLNYPKRNIRKTEIDGCKILRPEKIRYFLDAYYAPEMSRRNISTNASEYNDYARERTNTERFVMAYSAGARVSVLFPNHIALRTGLNYSDITERFDYVKETITIRKEVKNEITGKIDTIFENFNITENVYNHYSFLDIPLIVGYEIDMKDFVLSINTGIGFNVKANQKGQIYNTDGKTIMEINGSADGLVNSVFKSNVGVSLNGSFGLNYKIRDHLLLLIEPSARYYISSISKPEYPLSQKYLQLGLQLGLRYRIK